MKKINLHIGCGERYFKSDNKTKWIHIDLKKYPHIDYVTDASDLHMFEDNSVDLIYACHLLEHFKRCDTDLVLKEWYRVLKPGGILRLAVPDFSALVEVYNKYKDMGIIMGPLYGRGNPDNQHYIAFDFRYLKKRLQLIGFDKVRLWDWKTSDTKDYDDFSQSYVPHLQKETGILISLNVEAIK